MTFNEILNELRELTEEFTVDSGTYRVEDKGDVRKAVNILNKYYTNVNSGHLDYKNKEVDGTDYLIEFDTLNNEAGESMSVNESLDDKVLTSSDVKAAKLILKKSMNPKEIELAQKTLKKYSEQQRKVREAIEKHDELNPKLWDGQTLKPEVEAKLREIVQKFDDNLKDNDVELDVKDICIIGSNANYNYSPDSDVDLHIVADTSVYPDQEDLAMKVYLAYKSLFNSKYDPTINGIEVEIYVEPDAIQANSNGIYSLNDGWLKEPEQVDVPDIDPNHVQELIQPYEERYNELINGDPTIEDVDKLIDDIYLQRQSSIMKDGEFGDGNICFKEFRNRGYLQKLRDLKVELENKEMSLNDMNEQLLRIHGLTEECEDCIEEEYRPEDLFVGAQFKDSDDHKITVLKIDGDTVTCIYDTSTGPLMTVTDPINHVLASINSFNYKLTNKKGEELFNEEYEDYGTGIEFKFDDPETTLDIYLQWEGIIGYTDDIFEFGSIGYDDLEAYLDEEGIYGYTSQIYDIINGEPAFCRDMEEEDFLSLCRSNFIDPKEAFDEGLCKIHEGNKCNENYSIVDLSDGTHFGNYSTKEEAENKAYRYATDFKSKVAVVDDHYKVVCGYDTLGNRVTALGEDCLKEGTAFDSTPGFMSPEEIRAHELSKDAELKAEKDAERAARKEAAKARAKEERDIRRRREDAAEVENMSYDSLADMAGLDANNNDLTKDELLAVLRSNMSDRDIIKMHKHMFEDLEKDGDGFKVTYLDKEKADEDTLDESINVYKIVDRDTGELYGVRKGKTPESVLRTYVNNNVMSYQRNTFLNSLEALPLDNSSKRMFEVDGNEIYINSDYSDTQSTIGYITSDGKIELKDPDKWSAEVRDKMILDLSGVRPGTVDYKIRGFKESLDEDESLNEAITNAVYVELKDDGRYISKEIYNYSDPDFLFTDNFDDRAFFDRYTWESDVQELLDEFATGYELSDFKVHDHFEESIKEELVPNDQLLDRLNAELKKLKFDQPAEFTIGDNLKVEYKVTDDGLEMIDYDLITKEVISRKTTVVDNDHFKWLKSKLRQDVKYGTGSSNSDSSLNEESDKYVDYIEYLGKRSNAFKYGDDDTAAKELKKKFPEITDKDLKAVINRWHTGKLSEGYNRLKRKFDTIESAKKFVNFLDPDLDPRIEQCDTEDENGNIINWYEVTYWDNEDSDEDVLEEDFVLDDKPGTRYQNANGIIIEVTDPTAAGEIQFNIIEDGNILDCRKVSDLKSFARLIDANGYRKIEESCKSDLDEAIDDYDDVGKTLADYLGTSLEDMDYLGNNIYDTPEGEYFVSTEEEAHKTAVQNVKDILEDEGVMAFTPSFRQWIVDNAIDEKAVDKVIDQEIKYFELEEDDPDMLEFLRGLDTYDKKISYVNDLYADSFDTWATDFVDKDKVAEEAVSEDGIAHFLAYYDGEEIDLPNNLKAYRIN